jgi:hypothetical protein
VGRCENAGWVGWNGEVLFRKRVRETGKERERRERERVLRELEKRASRER